MTSVADELPPHWRWLDAAEAERLAPAFARELNPAHALAQADWHLIARHASQDSFVAEAPALNPHFYLLHLAWDQGGPKDPHPLSSLCELDGILEAPGDAIDTVSLWCHADSQQGAVFVQHLLDGTELLDLLDWPGPEPLPTSTQALEQMGWRQVTAPLLPHVWRDGAWQPTGQRVEYWTRPIEDDFMLLRAIETPGEAISLRKLIPEDGLVIEFDNQAALEAALPAGFYCRFVSPMAPRFGLAGYPPSDNQRPDAQNPSDDQGSKPGFLAKLARLIGR